MKFLVFSDSHGGKRYISAALAAHRNTVDAAIFLGDGISDMLYAMEEYPALPHILIRGNCDSAYASVGSNTPVLQENLQTLEGVRFWMLHGHTARVKYGYETLLARAAELEADAVLFGHTHIPENTSVVNPVHPEKRILLLNPGSIGTGTSHSYGVVYVIQGKISAGHGYAV